MSDFTLERDTEKQLARQIRHAAMDLLCRREHSRQELLTKLSRRFNDCERALIEQQLQRLVEDRLQSDERFVESFVNGRKRQGKGPARIRQELQQKGVSSYLISQCLEASRDEWNELALEVYLRKFGDTPVVDHKDRARRLRFMQYRGFDTQAIARLVA